METYGAEFLTPSFVIYVSKHHHHQFPQNKYLDSLTLPERVKLAERSLLENRAKRYD
jgi:hypothetical protein